MRLHHCVKEVLAIPPEGAAQATNTPVDRTGPASVARYKTTQRAA